MMELDSYGMFDYVAGDNDTYEYTSEEFNTFVDGLTDNGVSGKGNKYQVTKNGLELSVDTGICFINGRWGRNKETKLLTVDADAEGFSRIDYLVIESNKTTRKLGLSIVSGTHAASNPVAPTLTQTENLYQLPLYKLTVVGGATPTLTLEDVRTILILPSQVLSAVDSAVGDAVSDITAETLGAASNAEYSATIPASGWGSSAPYTQTVTVNGIVSTDKPLIDIVLSTDATTAKAELKAYGYLSKAETGTNQITLTCLETKPTTNYGIILKVVK